MRVYYEDFPKVCEIGAYHFNRIKFFFWKNGHPTAAAASEADLVVVQTCGHFTDRKHRSHDLVRRAIEESGAPAGGRRVVVFGCLVGLTDAYDGVEGVVQVGPKEFQKLDALIGAAVPYRSLAVEEVNRTSPPFSYQPYFLAHGGAYIDIGQGCTGRCTYCTGSKVKGWVESRPLPDVVSEITACARHGRRRITLLADDCGCWGEDRGTSVPDLLDAVRDSVPEVGLNFIYYHPAYLLRHLPRLRPHLAEGRIAYLNVPVQSASDRILRLMGRGYRIEEALAAVDEVRRLSPATHVAAHVIFGFPTETDEEFRAVLDLPRRFTQTVYILYCDHEDAPASRIRPKVSREDCARRVERLFEAIERDDLPAMVGNAAELERMEA